MEATFKTAHNLSDYAISPDGCVTELDTQETVKAEPNRPQGRNDYKLLTDEQVWLETKQKHIRLWRRFTKEELIKLYNRPDSKPVELGQQNEIPHPLGENVPDENVPAQNVPDVNVPDKENVPVSERKSAPVEVNGVKFNSIRAASLALNIDKRTISKRLDDPSNNNYKYI